MSAEKTKITKFIESILFEEYKKADDFLNQIVESKMKGKVKCACEDEDTEPFKNKKKKKSSKNNENTKKGDKEKPEWLKKLKKK